MKQFKLYDIIGTGVKIMSKKRNIWRIFSYFIIYSIIGLVIEMLYAIITKGTVESRRGFLYGPFCPIYGLGAVAMIWFLKKYFSKNSYTLFLGGFIVGSVVEYLISFIGEYVFNVKWWDYSNAFLNINGRICVIYSIFWGLLGVYLVGHLNKYVDKLLDKWELKIGIKKFNKIVLAFIIFLAIDGILTVFALGIFSSKLIYTYDLDVENKEIYIAVYSKLKQNENLIEVVDKVFSDRFMVRTFPNLKMTDKDGCDILVRELMPDINPYYYNFNKAGGKEREFLNTVTGN